MQVGNAKAFCPLQQMQYLQGTSLRQALIYEVQLYLNLWSPCLDLLSMGIVEMCPCNLKYLSSKTKITLIFVCEGQRKTVGADSLLPMWVQWVELRSSGVTANAFISWAVLLVLGYLLTRHMSNKEASGLKLHLLILFRQLQLSSLFSREFLVYCWDS